MTEPLTGVYSLGSTQRTADEESVRALAAAGEALRGFAPTVVRVTDVESSGDRVILELVDRWAGYVVVPAADPDGPALRPGAGRAEAPVRMVVVRTDGGWRIERAERSG
jgi:catechol 2,3-dioxygenase-like lactoylglutathione lyase family enzyme